MIRPWTYGLLLATLLCGCEPIPAPAPEEDPDQEPEITAPVDPTPDNFLADGKNPWMLYRALIDGLLHEAQQRIDKGQSSSDLLAFAEAWITENRQRVFDLAAARQRLIQTDPATWGKQLPTQVKWHIRLESRAREMTAAAVGKNPGGRGAWEKSGEALLQFLPVEQAGTEAAKPKPAPEAPQR